MRTGRAHNDEVGDASTSVLPNKRNREFEFSVAGGATDHSDLQAFIEEQMQMVNSCQYWRVLAKARELEQANLNSVSVEHGHANEMIKFGDGGALLEILRSKFPEGLVLRSTVSDGGYKRWIIFG